MHERAKGIYRSRILTAGNAEQAWSRDASRAGSCTPWAGSATNARGSRSRTGHASTSRAPGTRSAPRPAAGEGPEEAQAPQGDHRDAGHLAFPPHIEELQGSVRKDNLLRGAQVYTRLDKKCGRNFTHGDRFNHQAYTGERIMAALGDRACGRMPRNMAGAIGKCGRGRPPRPCSGGAAATRASPPPALCHSTASRRRRCPPTG